MFSAIYIRVFLHLRHSVYSDELIDPFELMKNIRSVELTSWNDNYRKSWVFDKCLSEAKSGPNGKAKEWQLWSRLL